MHKDSRVLVTGGTGYIATYCIARLLTEGYQVTTTVRSRKREGEVRRSVGRLGGHSTDALAIVEADLTKDAGWDAAMRDCKQVLHVASPFPAGSPKTDDELVKPARDGTMRVLAAARKAGVSRVVMTSSTAAVCYGRGGRTVPFTEADWSDATNLQDTSAYERSKTIAERAAWDWVKREGGAMEFVTVNPGAVLGPVFGSDFSASIQIVKQLLDGTIPGLAQFGWPLVDVRDIADLHFRALTSQRAAGQRYIGAGAFYWLSNIADVLRTRVPDLAQKVPTLRFPNWLVRISSRFDPAVGHRLYELGKLRPASSLKAQTELGWNLRSIDDSIVATAQSLESELLVKA